MFPVNLLNDSIRGGFYFEGVIGMKHGYNLISGATFHAVG